jgi:hypothetical protein
MSYQGDKIIGRLKNSLKKQGIEVFEWDWRNPPDIVPSYVLNIGSIIYKKEDEWFCVYIPENPRYVISKGKTKEEAMNNFDSEFRKELSRGPDMIECGRVYNMLEFEDVRTVLWELVSRLPDVDWVTASSICSWGDTLNGKEVLEWLEPLVNGKQPSYDVLCARDDIEELIDEEKLGEPLKEYLEGKKEGSPGLEIRYVDTPAPHVIGTILTEAEQLVSYTESQYIQTTEEYDINVINEIREIEQRIQSLKEKIGK